MIEWLITAAAGCLLLLVSFVVLVAVLVRDRARGERAVRVLRLLLVATAPRVAGALIKLHAVGLL
ncbi:hypothetical protein [Kutzneria sp. 744]|uniref:hypothetical protein n=1 Tax=Kutzneria sp. (strain 744) TaxID=345341 RepID=UPI0004B1AFD4|nr:hypothetical protein [Kutzneria sp. 744]